MVTKQDFPISFANPTLDEHGPGSGRELVSLRARSPHLRPVPGGGRSPRSAARRRVGRLERDVGERARAARAATNSA